MILVCQIILFTRGYRIWEQGVGGSNPLAPTRKTNKKSGLGIARPTPFFGFGLFWALCNLCVTHFTRRSRNALPVLFALGVYS